MTRLLVLVLLAYLVYLGLKTLMFRLHGAVRVGTLRPEAPSPSSQPPRRVQAAVHREGGEELVACSRCGTHVPRSRLGAGENGVVCTACGPLTP